MEKYQDVYAAHKAICKALGIEMETHDSDTALEILRYEIRDAEKQFRDQGYRIGRTEKQQILNEAADRLIVWHQTAKDYHFDKVYDFIATHRKSCVWVILRALNI